MSGQGPLRSRAHALAITAVLALGVFAAIVLAANGVPGAPARATAARAAHPVVAKNDAAARRASLPLYFEPNVGQSDPHVRFLSQSSRYTLFLTDEGAVFSLVGGEIHKGPTLATVNPPRQPQPDRLVQSAVRIRMVGANRHPGMTALGPLPGRVNYLIGNDPSKFHRGVPTYGRVRMSDVYPGIDVVYYGMPTSLEYDIVAAPGADTSRIHLAIEGGIKSAVDASGNIEINTAAGTIAVQKPRAYQRAKDGSEVPVASSFVAAQGPKTAPPEYSIQLASYDRTRPLIIDPTVQILYSSFLGGAAESVGPVNLEQFGGLTDNEPLPGIADLGADVALDPSNNAYVTGVAYSGAKSFPLVDAFQSTQSGANSPPNQNPVGFIAKFDTTKSGAASLIYSTYIGGSGDTNASDAGNGNGDLPFGIAVDGSGEPFIVGQTYSTNFPDTSTCGAFGQKNNQKATDVNVGFIAKLNAAGSKIVYACYIDGSNNATEARVALSPAGCDSTTLCKAYIAGSTQSDSTTGFPVTSAAFQKTLGTGANGKSNATFIVVHPDGSSLDYATLYGGAGNGDNADAGISVAVDSKGNGYITGATFSSNLPTKNPAVANYNSNASSIQASNAFVAEFNPSLSAAASLLYATYLGGSGADTLFFSIGDLGTAIKIDSSNHIWVAGVTASTDFTPGKAATVFQSTNEAETEAGPPATAGFIAELDPTQSEVNQVLYRTYFGGDGHVVTIEDIFSLGVGDGIVDLEVVDGKIYVTGITASASGGGTFPVSANACQTSNNTKGISIDGVATVPVTAFAAELDPSQSTAAAQLVFSTLLGGSGIADAGTGLAIDSSGDMVISGLTFSGDFPVTKTAFQSTNKATGKDATNAFLTVLDPQGTGCGLGGGTPVPTPAGGSPTPTPSKSSPTPTPAKSPTPTPIATPTPGGLIAVSANPLVFPNAGFGETPTLKTLIVQNLSAKHALVGAVGAPVAPFSITSGGGAFDLGPLVMLKVKLTFTPTGVGVEKGSLVITSNDKAKLSLTENLTGTGEPGVPTLSAAALVFGKVGIGLPGKTLTLKIHNTGLGALAGSVGALAAPFAVTAGGGPFGPIPPGGVVSVSVQFTPTQAAQSTAGLTITTSDPAKATLHVAVSGTGGPGVPTLSTNALAFGTVGIGVPPKTLTLKIHNTGLGELGGSVGVLGAPFAVTAGGGVFGPIAPGGTQSVSVQFTPTEAVQSTATLTITTTDLAKATLNVAVSGTGGPGHLATNVTTAPAFTSASETLAFGPVKSGKTKSLNFKIKNVGTGQLSGSVGSLAAPFTVTVGSGAFGPLAPGVTGTVTVEFAPAAAGPVTPEHLPITVTAPGKPPAGITITVSGRGT